MSSKDPSQGSKASPRVTTDGTALLRKRYVDGQPQRAEQLEQLRDDSRIGRRLCALRMDAGLDPRELAKRAGVSAATVEQIEAGAYEGDLLMALRSLAAALGKRIGLRFVSLPK